VAGDNAVPFVDQHRVGEAKFADRGGGSAARRAPGLDTGVFILQIKVTAPALSRALSRLAAARYDACEKRTGRVNGLAFTDLWE
jgi:hypothetical protein